MRINIGRKLCLAFFCTLTLCVLTMYLLMHNSLKRGFFDYTSQQAVQRLEILQHALVNIHQDEGSFAELTSDPARWLRLKSIIFSGDNLGVSAEEAHLAPDQQRSSLEYYREFVNSIGVLVMGTIRAKMVSFILTLVTSLERRISWHLSLLTWNKRCSDKCRV